MKEDLPEKQGLKQYGRIYDNGDSLIMKEDLPEKQGLKLVNLQVIDNKQYDERGSSRKTRIETINEDKNEKRD